jgi:uncharacterized sulfatase
MRVFGGPCVLFFFGWMAAATAAPNIVVVLVDDLGWNDWACFGNADARTPEVDRLAAEGLRFTQFYVNAPICSPSRTALTTGQYPQRWRISSYLDSRAANERRGMAQWLDPDAPALPRMLHAAGYATGHFGKWHMGGQRDVDDAPPIARYGFDASLTNFEGMGPKLLPLTRKPGGEQPRRIWADAERLGGPATWMDRAQITTGYVDAACSFIDAAARAGKPFYVNVWPDDVHSPHWPPLDAWREDKPARYLAVVEALDRQLGGLFTRIRDDETLRGNTLIIVCSDNGPEPGCGSAGPFRGAKGSLHEGGIRSPLIVWGPGLVPPQRAGARVGASWFAAFDLVPTLLSVAGVRPTDGAAFDGVDVSAALLGREATARRTPVCWRRPPDRTVGPDLAIRSGDWKLTCNYDGEEPRLYDLAQDPGERTHVAGREPAVVQQLVGELMEWHRAMPADVGPRLANPADRVRP